MTRGIPALGGTSSNTQKSPCSGDFGFGFPDTDEAAHSPPPPVTAQKHGQADGSGVFPLINKMA